MKRLQKIVALIVVMTMLFAFPVLADDRAATMISSESTADLVRQLDEYNLKNAGYVQYLSNYNAFALPNAPHAVLVSDQVKAFDILCCENHKLYLKNVLSAATTDLQNKQAQLNAATSQAAANPTFAAMVPQCQAQVAEAQAKVADVQNKIAAANQMLAKYY